MILLNVLLALAFIAPSLQQWLDPNTFWFLGFFSLAFPYIFILLIIFLFLWFGTSIPYSLISIIAFAIAWKQVDALINVKRHPFNAAKELGLMRVMSWNVKSFSGMETDQKSQDRNAAKIINLVEEMNPDLLCLQEFAQYDDPGPKRNYVKQLEERGFKYHIQSRDYTRAKPAYSNGLAIFSKYPFVSHMKVPFLSNPESILYADILFQGDTVRLFTTHLQSFKFTGTDYRDLEKIKNTEDSLYEASLNIYTKMKRAYRNRAAQAKELRALLDKSPYPEVLACDMNDVPNSASYVRILGNRNDAFAEKGFGIGRTFIALSPTLRIDYIFPNKTFAVKQFEVLQKQYSDHLPIVADLVLMHSNP